MRKAGEGARVYKRSTQLLMVKRNGIRISVVNNIRLDGFEDMAFRESGDLGATDEGYSKLAGKCILSAVYLLPRLVHLMDHVRQKPVSIGYVKDWLHSLCRIGHSHGPPLPKQA